MGRIYHKHRQPRVDPDSVEKLNILLESFYASRKEKQESLKTFVLKMKVLFADLNNHLKKHNENTITEKVQIMRVLTALGKGLHMNDFRKQWDDIPTKDRTLDSLYDKLLLYGYDEVENADVLSLGDIEDAEASAMAKEKVHIEHNMRKKRRFPCNTCKEIGHFARECPLKTFVRKERARY